MAKYRILKHEYPNGQVEYEVQKKLFGLIWWNFNNIDAFETGLYDTVQEAENAIKIDMEMRKTTAQYIDKAALVAEIENCRDNFYSLSKSCEKGTPAKAVFYAQAQTLEGIISFLDTIEVKEVDYNNTIIERACELLARMIWEVTYEDLEGNSVQHYDKMEFIEDFKKYMKGE